MSSYVLEDHGAGRFAVSGVLGFSTVARIFEQCRPLFEPHATIEIDFEGVVDSDSAGLALLLEWVNWSKHSVREIHFHNVPRGIRAIAEISEVEEMLAAGARWTG